MAAVLAVRAKQEEMGEAVVAAEEAIDHRVERREVSAALLARGRVIGLMAATLVGLRPIAAQAAALLAVGDKVVPEGDVVDQTGRVQDAQETRRDLSATMIGGTAEVIAKRVDAGRIDEMTRALWREGATDGEMTAVPVRETTGGVTPTEPVEVLEADNVKVGETLAAHPVLSGRNGRVKIAGRHAKNVNCVSHETKRNAEPLRCARVEAVPPA